MKTIGYIMLAIFLCVSSLLWFRGVDGSGLQNTFEVKIASLMVWGIFSLIILIIYVIVFFLLKRNQK